MCKLIFYFRFKIQYVSMVFFQQKYRKTLGTTFYIHSMLLLKLNFTALYILNYENIIDLYSTILCPQDDVKIPVLDTHQFAQLIGLKSGIQLCLAKKCT